MAKEPVTRMACMQGVDVLREEFRAVLREPCEDGIHIDVLVERLTILRCNGMGNICECRLGRVFLPESIARIGTEHKQHGQYSGTAEAQLSHNRGSFLLFVLLFAYHESQGRRRCRRVHPVPTLPSLCKSGGGVPPRPPRRRNSYAGKHPPSALCASSPHSQGADRPSYTMPRALHLHPQARR